MGGFFALLAALCFTLDSILIRIGLTEDNSGNVWEIRLVSMSMTLGMFVMAAAIAEVLGFNIIREFKALSLEILLILILSGIMGPLLGLLLLTTAVAQVGSSHASALWGGSNPLFATLFAYVVLSETPDLIGKLSVLMIIAGIVVVGYHRHAGTIMLMKKTKLAGGIIAILSGLCVAFSQIGRGMALDIGATPNTAFFVFQATALTVIAMVCFRKTVNFGMLKRISRKSIYFYLGAGICNFVGAYSLLMAFTLIPVWHAVAIRNIQPVFAVILSFILLKQIDIINIRLILGAFLVTAGVVVLNLY